MYAAYNNIGTVLYILHSKEDIRYTSLVQKVIGRKGICTYIERGIETLIGISGINSSHVGIWLDCREQSTHTSLCLRVTSTDLN